ncbi:hypothetical protein, partial [Rathayibacter rathayi]|uniref:hypothetical protein n=1 Tax=Rathayibacter rathayi TaxID=33887 RepID=UPI0015E2836A
PPSASATSPTTSPAACSKLAASDPDYTLNYDEPGKSPVRFRWAVDTKTGQVESDWTYYDDLTAEEKKDDFWENWEGDFAWKAQLEAELAGE